MSTSAQTIAHPPPSAVSPEIAAALQLMFAPGIEFRTRTAGRKTVAESDGGKRNRYFFAILPNERSPRMLIPIQSGSCTRRALQQIQVFATGAKAAKLMLQVVSAVGVLPTIAKTLDVSSDRGSSLFDKVAQLTGRPDVCFAVTFGTPSGYRKLTITAMLPDGEPVAFVKVPMATEAIARVEHEGEMLQALSRTALVNCVPRVLLGRPKQVPCGSEPGIARFWKSYGAFSPRPAMVSRWFRKWPHGSGQPWARTLSPLSWQERRSSGYV